MPLLMSVLLHCPLISFSASSSLSSEHPGWMLDDRPSMMLTQDWTKIELLLFFSLWRLSFSSMPCLSCTTSARSNPRTVLSGEWEPISSQDTSEIRSVFCICSAISQFHILTTSCWDGCNSLLAGSTAFSLAASILCSRRLTWSLGESRS